VGEALFFVRIHNNGVQNTTSKHSHCFCQRERITVVRTHHVLSRYRPLNGSDVPRKSVVKHRWEGIYIVCGIIQSTRIDVNRYKGTTPTHRDSTFLVQTNSTLRSPFLLDVTPPHWVTGTRHGSGLETSGTNKPVKWCHILKERRPQLHCCENPQCSKFQITLCQ
jgi:hypothetical protein